MWQPGTPITGYYHGPGGGTHRWGPLTPGMARKLVDGGFNLAPNGNPTHALVVNLDYDQQITTTAVGPGPMEEFDARQRQWRPVSDGPRAKLNLVAGGGKLLRLRQGS